MDITKIFKTVMMVVLLTLFTGNTTATIYGIYDFGPEFYKDPGKVSALGNYEPWVGLDGTDHSVGKDFFYKNIEYYYKGKLVHTDYNMKIINNTILLREAFWVVVNPKEPYDYSLMKGIDWDRSKLDGWGDYFEAYRDGGRRGTRYYLTPKLPVAWNIPNNGKPLRIEIDTIKSDRLYYDEHSTSHAMRSKVDYAVGNVNNINIYYKYGEYGDYYSNRNFEDYSMALLSKVSSIGEYDINDFTYRGEQIRKIPFLLTFGHVFCFEEVCDSWNKKRVSERAFITEKIPYTQRTQYKQVGQPSRLSFILYNTVDYVQDFNWGQILEKYGYRSEDVLYIKKDNINWVECNSSGGHYGDTEEVRPVGCYHPWNGMDGTDWSFGREYFTKNIKYAYKGNVVHTDYNVKIINNNVLLRKTFVAGVGYLNGVRPLRVLPFAGDREYYYADQQNDQWIANYIALTPKETIATGLVDDGKDLEVELFEIPYHKTKSSIRDFYMNQTLNGTGFIVDLFTGGGKYDRDEVINFIEGETNSTDGVEYRAKNSIPAVSSWVIWENTRNGFKGYRIVDYTDNIYFFDKIYKLRGVKESNDFRYASSVADIFQKPNEGYSHGNQYWSTNVNDLNWASADPSIKPITKTIKSTVINRRLDTGEVNSRHDSVNIVVGQNLKQQLLQYVSNNQPFYEIPTLAEFDRPATESDTWITISYSRRVVTVNLVYHTQGRTLSTKQQSVLIGSILTIPVEERDIGDFKVKPVRQIGTQVNQDMDLHIEVDIAMPCKDNIAKQSALRTLNLNNQTEIYEQDIKDLTNFSYRDEGITELCYIKQMKKLKNLDISGNNFISDPSSINGKNLDNLDISNTSIVSLENIDYGKRLNSLKANNSKLKVITGDLNDVRIKHIELNWNNFTDFDVYLNQRVIGNAEKVYLKGNSLTKLPNYHANIKDISDNKIRYLRGYKSNDADKPPVGQTVEFPDGVGIAENVLSFNLENPDGSRPECNETEFTTRGVCRLKEGKEFGPNITVPVGRYWTVTFKRPDPVVTNLIYKYEGNEYKRESVRTTPNSFVKVEAGVHKLQDGTFVNVLKRALTIAEKGKTQDLIVNVDIPIPCQDNLEFKRQLYMSYREALNKPKAVPLSNHNNERMFTPAWDKINHDVDIRKSVFFTKDVLGIKSLKMHNADINSWECFKYFKNLERLDLTGNEITNLNDMPEKLEAIKVSNNPIESIKGLEGRIWKYVDLSGIDVESIDEFPSTSRFAAEKVNAANMNIGDFATDIFGSRVDFVYLRDNKLTEVPQLEAYRIDLKNNRIPNLFEAKTELAPSGQKPVILLKDSSPFDLGLRDPDGTSVDCVENDYVRPTEDGKCEFKEGKEEGPAFTMKVDPYWSEITVKRNRIPYTFKDPVVKELFLTGRETGKIFGHEYSAPRTQPVYRDELNKVVLFSIDFTDRVTTLEDVEMFKNIQSLLIDVHRQSGSNMTFSTNGFKQLHQLEVNGIRELTLTEDVSSTLETLKEDVQGNAVIAVSSFTKLQRAMINKTGDARAIGSSSTIKDLSVISTKPQIGRVPANLDEFTCYGCDLSRVSNIENLKSATKAYIREAGFITPVNILLGDGSKLEELSITENRACLKGLDFSNITRNTKLGPLSLKVATPLSCGDSSVPSILDFSKFENLHMGFGLQLNNRNNVELKFNGIPKKWDIIEITNTPVTKITGLDLSRAFSSHVIIQNTRLRSIKSLNLSKQKMIDSMVANKFTDFKEVMSIGEDNYNFTKWRGNSFLDLSIIPYNFRGPGGDVVRNLDGRINLNDFLDESDYSINFTIIPKDRDGDIVDFSKMFKQLQKVNDRRYIVTNEIPYTVIAAGKHFQITVDGIIPFRDVDVEYRYFDKVLKTERMKVRNNTRIVLPENFMLDGKVYVTPPKASLPVINKHGKIVVQVRKISVPVDIPDPQLKKAVTDNLTYLSTKHHTQGYVKQHPIDTLYAHDLEELVDLSVNKVHDFEGMQHAKNIEKLTMDNVDEPININKINDKTLSTLIVQNSKNFNNLDKFTNLKELKVIKVENHNLVERPCTSKLQTLSVEGAGISDIKQLGRAVCSIVTLDLSNNKLDKVDLTELSKLENFIAVKNRIYKITAGDKVKNLDLRNNSIAICDAMKLGNANLESLDVSRNSIKDLRCINRVRAARKEFEDQVHIAEIDKKTGSFKITLYNVASKESIIDRSIKRVSEDKYKIVKTIKPIYEIGVSSEHKILILKGGKYSSDGTIDPDRYKTPYKIKIRTGDKVHEFIKFAEEGERVEALREVEHLGTVYVPAFNENILPIVDKYIEIELPYKPKNNSSQLINNRPAVICCSTPDMGGVIKIVDPSKPGENIQIDPETGREIKPSKPDNNDKDCKDPTICSSKAKNHPYYPIFKEIYEEVKDYPRLKQPTKVEAGFEIKEPTFTPDNIDKIKSLDLRNKGLTSVEGIQYLEGLEEIYLDNNKVVDLTPLNKLKNLKKVTISNNPIKNFKFPDTLEYLDISNTGFGDSNISELSNLRILNTLVTNNNNLNKTGALSNIGVITKLYAANNKVTQMPTAPTYLELDFSRNNLTEVPVGLPNGLLKINLSSNYIKNMAPVPDTANLTMGTQTIDIIPSGNVFNLELIDKSGNKVFIPNLQRTGTAYTVGEGEYNVTYSVPSLNNGKWLVRVTREKKPNVTLTIIYKDSSGKVIKKTEIVVPEGSSYSIPTEFGSGGKEYDVVNGGSRVVDNNNNSFEVIVNERTTTPPATTPEVYGGYGPGIQPPGNVGGSSSGKSIIID